MKPKFEQTNNQKGFTLVELMVVVAIMALMSAVLIADFNRNRTVRSIMIAKNETATNIRKAQGYLLSSKNIAGNIPAKFYIVTFVTSGGGTSYTIDAIDNNYNYYGPNGTSPGPNPSVERINLPTGVKISAITTSNGTQQISQSCMQIVFAAPLGEEYVVPSCGPNIVDTVRDPVQLAAQSQKPAYIYFQGTNTTVSGSNFITILPLTGQLTTQ